MSPSNQKTLRSYGFPFLQHTYLHHVTRIDHRHNFSPYNTLLYISSATPASKQSFHLESLAFLPQLFLSAFAIPLTLAKKDLPSTMLAQTFAFVSFNKVCTSQVSFHPSFLIISLASALHPLQFYTSPILSNPAGGWVTRALLIQFQYFLWYMVFLPFYLPTSSLLSNRTLGLSAAALWVSTQGLWLQQGFQLEFLGRSTFVPGLWMAGILFFLTNTWILGIVVTDVGLGNRVKLSSGKGGTM